MEFSNKFKTNLLILTRPTFIKIQNIGIMLKYINIEVLQVFLNFLHLLFCLYMARGKN